MAATDLPCDGDGICMVCKAKPPESEALICNLCATPWHVPCLSSPPETMSSAVTWECPDCCPPPADAPASAAAPVGVGSELVSSIRAIEADDSLTEAEKARKRQELVGGTRTEGDDDDAEEEKKGTGRTKNNMMDLIDEKFNCTFCMQLLERPVTTPCGHNFCLKCFQKWIAQRKNTCAKCRSPIPPKMASLPRINSALVMAIRMAKVAKHATSCRPAEAYHYIRNENRPDKAFTTERAKKSGKANACSGQIFVTIPPDYFGPITAEYDPRRNQGVLVGETWEDRMECRQWGTHFPHVAGIAGQSDHGAQSVALSGGYEDDEDHGEWFLYTGSGGRDLSGNKRTNKEHSFDQKFEKLNKALRVSCLKGYPVRVVRSHKEKRSSYAPESGVRYDGVYRIEKCWRKAGKQGFKMCRYLFVRCDNEPAPWTSDEHGDRPRPLPVIKELKNATDVAERAESPAWDYNEKTGWKWMKPPPLSKKSISSLSTQEPEVRERAREAIKQAHSTSIQKRLLKEFSCLICRKVMKLPLTTPCAHNFCKSCLLGKFTDLTFVKERTRGNGRTLRAQKIVNNCPCCPTDISEFLQNPQVNRDLMDLIESLQTVSKHDEVEEASDEPSDVSGKLNETNNDIKDRNMGPTTDSAGFEVAEVDTENLYTILDNKLNSIVEDSAPVVFAGKGGNSNTAGGFPPNEASPISSVKRKGTDDERVNAKKLKRVGKNGSEYFISKDGNVEIANESSVVHVSSHEEKCQNKYQDPNSSPSPSGTPHSLNRRNKSNVAISPAVRTRSMKF